MVDSSKYKTLFIDETTDNIAIINETLSFLGEEPSEGEEEPVQILFRAFHSIKGMAASMNYRQIQEVAHKLEDLLDEVRKGNIEVNESIQEILYEGASLLEKLVDIIGEDSDEKVDTESFLKRLLMVSTVTHAQEETIPSPLPQEKKEEPQELQQEDLADLNVSGKNQFEIKVTVTKDSISPPARAYLLVQSLKEKSEVSKTIPSIDEMSAGKMERDFTAFIATTSTEDEVRSVINASVEIEKYEIKNITVALGARNGEPEKLHVRAAEVKEASAPVIHYRKPGAVKVESSKIDGLLNVVGEMFIRENQLRDIVGAMQSRESTESINQMEKLVRKLYKAMMTLRLVQISLLSDMIPRVIREVLKGSDKKTELVVIGKDIELDRTIIEKLGDPLIHLIRNSLDHGIEPPDERKKAEKPEVSTLTFKASRERDNIILELSDDGRGLDIEKIKTKVVAKGIANREYLDTLQDEEIFQYIFMSGLSTTEKVSAVSGRGVGMDIVKNAVDDLGGKISLTSTAGEGCCFRLQIPMSIALIKTFRIELNGDIYAIPVGKILHTIELPKEQLQNDKQGVYFSYRDERIPVKALKSILRYDTHGEKLKKIVPLLIVDAGEGEIKKTALIVDSLLAIYDTVIKSLSNPLKKIEIFSGVTISEKGDLILILDVEKLFI
ncbi:MAG: chemotaxis protein CheA [Nitrospinae bacterium]|nr:chemotaxis protein CheA [Nitrospinota bacterium]